MESWRAFLHTDCDAAIAIANVLGIILFGVIMLLSLVAVKRRYLHYVLKSVKNNQIQPDIKSGHFYRDSINYTQPSILIAQMWFTEPKHPIDQNI